MVSKGIFEGGLDDTGRDAHEDYEEAADADWGEALDIDEVDKMQNGDITMALDEEDVHNENDEEGGWDLEDLDLPPDAETPKTASSARSSVFISPTPGMPSQLLARVDFCAGDLRRGREGLERVGESERAGPPALIFSFSQLEEKLRAGYKATTAGKFSEALRHFLAILHTIPLIVVETRREVDEVKELIVIVKEYVLSLQMELKRRELKDDPVRQQELAAYFTHCNLQLPHTRLALMNAMTVCFKAQNMSTAANFARRLLETNPSIENQAIKARQVLQAAERNMRDATEINYDFRNPFVVCGATYVPIYRGQKDVTCPYCGTHFVPSQQGQLCTVCDLAAIGSDASGLLCSPSQIR
ncbi:hypothetical protein DH2020_047379 [Rehmannia glutinosa]|uniref:Coatomer alpha subunit C-terminal domain-containing protein n=1 Tax=Rehmannia glutinosa TaxID=99300 RepID=A0ABR0U8Q1_REHGL